MKRHFISLVGFAALTLGSGGALAACSDELARLMPGTTTGSVAGGQPTEAGRIAKDGNNAPLQTNSAGQAQSTAQANRPAGDGVAKDGQTSPLATQPGAANPGVATSGQDAQAQQRPNQPTSSSDARNPAPTTRSPAMMAALDRARTMQQQGNESGCMDAVNEAKRLQ